MADFSDYIIYADESGSPVLDGVDPNFPVFVLVFVLVHKDVYSSQIVPQLQQLKFDFVGHDQLVLHERDIRRQKDDFAFLQTSAELRQAFLSRIDQIVFDADIRVFATVVHKSKLIAKYSNPWSPYEIALYLCMERVLFRLAADKQAGKNVHVVFERRGAKEDAELELDFHRIANNQSNWGYRSPDFKQVEWEPLFADKRCNSSGLQLADLFARPIGLKCFRQMQANHAYEVILPKLALGSLKWFP